MPFAEGENIGPYRVVEQLGQGGMATVYKAYHAALDRYVALKVLHPAFHEDPNFIGRFQREARVVAKLEHPNIVPIYDFAEHEKQPYLVMKYIEGKTLKARLTRGPLCAVEVTQVADAVGSALAYAHKQGILHRDIKPSNVLIANDGQMYLADFGLARIAQAGESTLSSDSIMGTPQYISPEQARGDKDLDAGTDIYSFGVMLYEMVVGRVPFSADTPFSIIHDHIYTPLPMPRSVNINVSESVERVLLKALSKERADRYEDALSMVEAFKAAWEEADMPVQGSVLTSPPVPVKQEKEEERADATEVDETAVSEEPKPKKKRSPWLYVAAGVLLVICCIFVFFAWRKNRVAPFVNREPEPPPSQVVDVLPPEEPRSEEPEPPPPRPEGELPPEVLEAQHNADTHPDDPFARLELALVFWDAGMRPPSYENLDHAAELAGDDIDFFLEAGRGFHVRQAWVGSASMYLRVFKILGPGGEVPEEAYNNFHEAVYMTAPSPEFENLARMLDEILKVDEPIGLVALARHAYHNGRQDEGRELLNEVKRLKPDFIEALLLEAEFAMLEERFEVAGEILPALIENPETPAWIRAMAEEFLNHIP